jgi:class 3 adenylate cyclase
MAKLEQCEERIGGKPTRSPRRSGAPQGGGPDVTSWVAVEIEVVESEELGGAAPDPEEGREHMQDVVRLMGSGVGVRASSWQSRGTAAAGGGVTGEIRDEILARRVALESHELEVTILFADLRDFMPWVEATPPREVVRDLSAYFTEMEQAIRAEGGFVLQFIGDEIEAAFGAQVAWPDHAHRAVQAALEMRRRLAAWNADRAWPLQHGIGVHTGLVLAGNIGSPQRVSHALVGDTVNLASRIQGLTKEVGVDILVSGSTRARLGDEVAVAGLPPVRVKGRSKELEVYRVL